MRRNFLYTPRKFNKFVNAFIRSSGTSSPRGLDTHEIINCELILKNPLDRVVVDRGRKMNIGFAIAEFIGFIGGIDDIGFYKMFISSYDKFSSDGVKLDGAYGTRVVKDGISQINQVVKTLIKDKDSRRAVISIYERDDLFGGGGLNTPCTLSLQFFIRLNSLICIANMRSCDIVKGLTYDAFVFSLVQELIARELQLPLGYYHHNANSLHFYETDLEMLEKCEMIGNKKWPHLMEEMPSLKMHSYELLVDAARRLDDFSASRKLAIEWTQSNVPALKYYGNMLACMLSFISRKSNQSDSRSLYTLISDKTLRYVLRQWIY